VASTNDDLWDYSIDVFNDVIPLFDNIPTSYPAIALTAAHDSQDQLDAKIKAEKEIEAVNKVRRR
jgi:hypothetical protein